ncbi:50S ribosomal protein L11 methyltransferase [Marinagarivorans algicola]|uniref:50S ribosomal protein L11 methyltransferase n=1 Tax=Marinagarivorans algicola TaxID=1513270 RepID=UPI0006B56CA5|nr:50S ribosomal protein L11 methyltransferase [Marinagarivorans algicola]
MPWLEIHINTNRDDAPAIEDHLMAAGALSVTLTDNEDQPIFEPALGETPLWSATRVTGLFDADINTQIIDSQLALPASISFKWHIVEDKDWEREWMQHYHPIQCGEQFWICPSWIAPPNPSAVNLMLDPGLAFGTGTHPTTFLCLQWLAEQNITSKHVIDYGCGSGILGIGALLLGAQKVLGVDIDPQALLATQDNAQRNNIPAEQFPVVFPDKCQQTPVDIMLANILAGPLVELAPVLTPLVKTGGKLCLSGILATQAQAVQDAYSDAFTFDPVAQKEEWVRLSAIKKG